MRRLLFGLVCLAWTAALWGDDAIPLKTLTDLKSATVFIKVEAGREAWSGSGFLMKVDGDTGYIVTNNHVATSKSKNPVKPTITLVFWSGTKQERSVRAQVLGTDPDRDLALLKCTGVKDLPRPVDLSQKAELVETMPVFVCGFPFGAALSTTKGNPGITVGKGTVSSIRTDEHEEIAVVQIDGALNPGNSGGPVVDSKGRLVGVAVATIKGSGLGFAIPPQEVSRMLHGRLSGVAFASRKADKGVAEVQVRFGRIDPLEKLKSAQLYYVRTTSLKAPVKNKDRLDSLPGVQKIDLQLDKQFATCTFQAALPSNPQDTLTWQLAYVNGEGQSIITFPRVYRIDLSGGALPPPILTTDKRLPTPESPLQAKAEAVIKDLYKAEYAKRKPAEMVALAGKLLTQGVETRDDAPARYVLFREASDLAARGGDLALALKAVEAMDQVFVINSPAAKLPVFETIGPKMVAPLDNKALVERVLPVVEDALTNDDFDMADRLLRVADAAAKRSKNVAAVTAVENHRKDLTSLRQLYDKVKSATGALARDPKDPEAALDLGKYYCFNKGDWDGGLPLLAIGKDAKLRAQAQKDQGGPTSSAEQLDLADGWYDLAAAQDPAIKRRMQLRALQWYQQAFAGLTGLNKTKAEKRLAELSPLASTRLAASSMFEVVRSLLKEKRYAETEAIGFRSDPTVQEVPPDGALLIGFEVGLGKFVKNDIVVALRPIYLTAQGEKKGTAYGRLPIKVLTVKAKKGYAVGGMRIRGGLGVDGFSMTFMRIDKTSLNKQDSYESEWIGGKGGTEGKVGGDGSLAIGIAVRRKDDGNMSGLGLVLGKPVE